ncbi:MAG: tetratricopeptide repeat protein [Treponema sp.]|jgi:tetratricopeptide (TPR) repeat protein|nr:tetratricopeptide repeat protein [Treponema sp.]
MAVEEKVAEQNAGLAVAGFIQKNRKPLAAGMVSILVLAAAFITGIGIRDAAVSRAVAKADDLCDRFEALRIDINNSEKAGEIEGLLEELKVFAEKNSGYAGARAYVIIADIYADKKDWAAAEKAWTRAAETAPKIYLAPVSLYNAGAAAEEQGNIEGAISLYKESVSYGDFPAAPRAQLNIGRLEEERHNKDAALEAYRTVIEKWPYATVWTNLANNRIIALNLQ